MILKCGGMLMNLKTQDPILGHHHVSDKSSILQGVEIKLNSEGMRSDEFDD
jgi:hypothetical protein